MVQSGQRLVNEIAWARRIEPPSQHTWPAQDVVALAGWQMRFSGGHGHRANSVAAFAFSGDDVPAAIDAVESQYRERGLRPMFQITTGVAPINLAEILKQRGYRAITPSLVCVAEAQTVRDCCPSNPAGKHRFDANAGFDALVISGSHSPNDGRERLAVLERIAVPLLRVTVEIDGQGVACGMGAAADGLVGINLMRTDPAFRRRGCARHVLGAIAGWALQQGADTLFLSVERDNVAARALYERAGFRIAYDYLYYVRD